MQRRNGFSLIEMLMVFTVIGLLASIVIIQVGGVRSRAYLTALRSDLRNFAVAQESYYYDFDIYTANTTQLAGRGFQTSKSCHFSAFEFSDTTRSG